MLKAILNDTPLRTTEVARRQVNVYDATPPAISHVIMHVIS
jgi:hypothetical protein